MRQNKRRAFFAGMTLVLCMTIMLSGTFAWQSISQTAKNETMGQLLNPGGRLHDDFNGQNKDIYVENFTSQNDGLPIIVRIRLFEYMEIGEDAGTNLEPAEGTTRDVTVLSNANADISKPGTWDLYIPGVTADKHYDYWNWTMGGQTVYMPTFNKNKDSLSADINGTYEGTTAGDIIHFDDYKFYTVGKELEGTAYYDADDNAEDDTGYATVTETHAAKKTIDGTVISMAEWESLSEDKKLGDFWVYDTDGWAYWANPLMPDTATGLLLDEIKLSQTITEKWYYGIWVESQMVTADEIGDANNKVGFYSENAGKEPSTSAKTLLDKITVKINGANASLELSGETETTELEATEAETAEVPVTEAQAIEADLTVEDTTETDTTGEDTTETDTTGEDTTETDTTGEDTTETDTAETDITKEDTTEGESTEPEPTEPESTEPEITEQKQTEPEPVELEPTESGTTRAETTE